MEKLFDVIFADLRSSKKSVNRLLSLGVLFALFGHFYIVEPYFQYKDQERNLSFQQREVEAMSQGLRSILCEVKDQIEGYPAEFRKVRDKIYQNLYPTPSLKPLKVGKIILPAGTTFGKGVPFYVETWFTNLINKLEKGVKAEVTKLRSKEKESEDTILQFVANKAIKDFQEGMKKLEEDNPQIWLKYEGVEGEAATDKLQNLVVVLFEPVNNEVNSLMKKAAEKLKTVKEEIGKLEPRINSLVSQLGPVPVRLTDFIVLFPLFLVALLVMITATLHKSGCLYLAFWYEFSKENTTKDRGEFQQFADCWYLPPYKSIVQLLSLIVLMAVVSAMFIRASLLVIINAEAELFTFLLSAEDSSTKSIFTAAYIFGAFIVVGCFGLIFKTLRRITQETIE